MFTRFELVVEILKGLAGWLRALWQAVVAKYLTRTFRLRHHKQSTDVIFVTYFPLVEKEAASMGNFRNKMAGALQEMLTKTGKQVVWICIYVPYDGYSYADAAKMVRRFRKHGEKIYLLQEFTTFGVASRALYNWVKKVVAYLRLRSYLTPEMLTGKIAVPEAASLVRKMFDKSFAGWVGMAGLIFLEQFGKVFRYIRDARYCIYYSEMHEWEKALNSACRRENPLIKTVAFQHTNVTSNFFHYLCTPEDFSASYSPYPMPMPDIFACNGTYPLRYMEKNGIRAVMVEAVRQLHLRDYLDELSSGMRNKQDVILFAGTIDPLETKAILTFLIGAKLPTSEVQVWLKGHPSYPIEQALNELGINVEELHWNIRREAIEELLKVAKFVVVGSSTVALEALVYQCRVFVPILPECMCMSPLSGFADGQYVRVTNPKDLKDMILESMREGQHPFPVNTGNIIEAYWCLDRSLKRWKAILE